MEILFKILLRLLIDLMICFCGFGLGYKKGWKERCKCCQERPPLPTGHWIMRHYVDSKRQGFNMWVCSECYKEFSYDAETGVGITDANYCPNCGSAMQEADNG